MYSISLTFMSVFIITAAVNYSSDYNKNTDDNSNQCPRAEFIAGQLGVVNVLAFLDATQPSSYRQAVMLKILKDRLHRSGLPEALFFVIINNSTDKSSEKIVESDNRSIDSLKSIIAPDIFIIEDNEELRIWQNFNGSKDQVIVIDRCGYLAYQIIVPWSILHFPYVKAAILSTHKDDPCGSCDTYATVIELDETEASTKDLDSTISEITESIVDFTIPEGIPVDKTENLDVTEDKLTISNDLERVDESENFFSDGKKLKVDLRIIMHAPHYHMNGDATKKHEYLVQEYSKPNYHGHLDVPESNKDDRSTKLGDDLTLSNSIVFERDEGPGFFGEIADYWHDVEINNPQTVDVNADEDDESSERSKIDQDITTEISAEITENTEGEITDEEEIRNKLIAHYSKLLPWIYYVLEK
ncbi:uncharacterized protein LOC103580542 [Microplitis demolitor]|uniref:uncharacterized protein LOC103580542 n=1 Tax=Microplitis demolitor TaxID=69319 RepID=UPI0004CCDBD0|nr:uncharacterized protein LOC103580542 [Microplitis demolitor]